MVKISIISNLVSCLDSSSVLKFNLFTKLFKASKRKLLSLKLCITLRGLYFWVSRTREANFSNLISFAYNSIILVISWLPISFS